MSAAKTIIPRIPRYNLFTEDDGRVRIAEGARYDGPIIEGRLANLSATGALIELRDSNARLRFLDEGEMIKIELAVPARGRFAFYATVIRLEPSVETPDVWELALLFRNLPSALKEMLDRHITPASNDYSHPGNFDHALQKGFTHAAGGVLRNRWGSLARSASASPLWWLAVLAFAAASLLPRLAEVFRATSADL